MLDDKIEMMKPANNQKSARVNCQCEKTGYVWHSVQEYLPECGIRVLTFSPCYEAGSKMRIRIMDGQFVKICTDVTQWCCLPIEPSANRLEKRNQQL